MRNGQGFLRSQLFVQYSFWDFAKRETTTVGTGDGALSEEMSHENATDCRKESPVGIRE